MRLFQAPLDTCLDSPFFASLSVHGLHFTVYAPSSNFQYAIFVLEFAGPLVSKRGFHPQYVSIFDRCAASTRSLLDMFRFSFDTKFGKDKKPIKIRQNTQRVEISIRNATRRKRRGSGPLRLKATSNRSSQNRHILKFFSVGGAEMTRILSDNNSRVLTALVRPHGGWRGANCPKLLSLYFLGKSCFSCALRRQ